MPASPSRVALANTLRGSFRALRARGAPRAVAAAAAALSAAAFAVAAGWATAALLGAVRVALPQLPRLKPEFLLERVLAAGLLSAAFLLVLGALTTGVSTLFLAPQLSSLAVLPLPRGWLFRRQLLRSVGLASGPLLLVTLPALAVAAARAPRPALAATAGVAVLAALALGTGTLGSVAALLLVRVAPPRRALLLAGALSAAGLSAALVGVRLARPERLFDPVAAVQLLETLGTTPPPAAGLDPAAQAARALTRALTGDAAGLGAALVILAASVGLLAAMARWLAPLHGRVLEECRTGAGATGSRRVPGRPVPSLRAALLRAEAASLLRDAATPAQIGSLLAVFVLQFLNLGLLPAGEAAARDVLAGLETGLALFLVSALSLRFCYPGVSGDGRAALLLRSVPLPPARHLAARYAVRAVPTAAAGLLLMAASLAVLRPPADVAASAVAVALVGSLALPALHLGLGALFPRYDEPNAIAVALGSGGLFALVLSTALSLGAAAAVSDELRLLAGALAGVPLGRGPLIAGWCGAALGLGAIALTAGARSLARTDLAVS